MSSSNNLNFISTSMFTSVSSTSSACSRVTTACSA
ncbi:hypothetical protein 2011_scaffold13_00036 [Bacteriophage sp.]|nr:hypothetical protein 2011_scaffold13_00036 [Bacteriophage sp.]